MQTRAHDFEKYIAGLWRRVEMGREDRRRATRYELGLSMRVFVRRSTRPLVAVVKDIGSSGVLFEAPKAMSAALAAGSRIRVEIELGCTPEERSLLICKAAIVRAEQGSDRGIQVAANFTHRQIVRERIDQSFRGQDVRNAS